MKKSYLVYLIITVVLIGGGLIYYYPQNEFSATDQPVITPTSALVERRSSEGNETNDNRPEEEKEENGDISVKKVYSYRKSFRNPFADYRITEEGAEEILSSNIKTVKVEEIEVIKGVQGEKVNLTAEKIKSIVPFQLKGIIGNNKERLAIIETRTGSRIIKQKETIDEFQIDKIMEDSLLVTYKAISFKIEMGSGSGGS